MNFGMENAFSLALHFFPACKWMRPKQNEICMWGREGNWVYFVYKTSWIRFTNVWLQQNQKKNLRVKKLDLNQLNRLQLFTIYSTITRRYTLRDQTEVPFFKGIQTKREQTEQNWKRTQIKLQRQRMQDSKDMHSYIVLYIQQICKCVCVQVPLLFATPAPQFQRSWGVK